MYLELLYVPHIEIIRSILIHLHGFEPLALLPQLREITAFICVNRISLLHLKKISSRLIVSEKGSLKLPNLLLQIKQKSITSQNLGPHKFLQIANCVLKNGKSPILTLVNNNEVLWSKFFLLRKNCLQKAFLKNFILTKECLYPAFCSRTNLKMHDIPETPKFFRSQKLTFICERSLVLIVFQ